jgi:predicted O-methyltransferase YrrM
MGANLVFFKVARYLKYIFLSSGRKGHGIQSPFVFDIVTRLFDKKKVPEGLSRVEKVRERLKNDNRIIKVNDLGAGSAGEGQRFRKVSDIVRFSAVPKKFGILLSRMAHEFGNPLILEFGTSFGISTMYLASGCSGTQVLTMEGSSALAEIAEGNFNSAGLSNIRVLTGSFEAQLSEITVAGLRPGLVFIDGNHRKIPTLEYFDKITRISGPETVVIIDDINYSVEMSEAWNCIKEHEKVSVSIDILRMGIVFFRKGIGRQNYMIRY